jgi:hypothetical protein
VEEETGTPTTTLPTTTLPPTDLPGSGSGTQDSNAWRLMLVAMAGLLATVLLLTPSKAPRRR